MPRLFVRPDPADSDRATLDADGARHLRALRVAVGGTFEAIVGEGSVRIATVGAFSRAGASLTLGARVEVLTDPRRPVILAAALADLARFDSLVEKATELGATTILPLRSARCQVDRLTAARRRRWQRIARSACEQCGRTVPPEIADPVDLPDLAGRLPDGARCVVLHPDAPRVFDGDAPADRPLVLVVGPEGGFTSAEVDALVQAGADARSLGPRTLRFETAATAALAIAGIGAGHLR